MTTLATTFFGAITGVATIMLTTLESALPAELAALARYAPESVVAAEAMVNVAFVAPAIGVPLLLHCHVSGGVPSAVAENAICCPTLTVSKSLV